MMLGARRAVFTPAATDPWFWWRPNGQILRAVWTPARSKCLRTVGACSHRNESFKPESADGLKSIRTVGVYPRRNRPMILMET